MIKFPDNFRWGAATSGPQSLWLNRDDIHTQIKTLKKSGHWYRKLSDTNVLEDK